MKITSFNGVTEKNAILVTTPTQAIEVTSSVAFAATSTDTIEVSLVDFRTGKEERILRKTKIWKMMHTVGLKSLAVNTKKLFLEIADDVNYKLDGNTVLRINLAGLTAGTTYEVFAIPANSDGNTFIRYETMSISAGIPNQKFPVNFHGQLLMPETDLDNIRILWTNGKEQILSLAELKDLRDLAITTGWGQNHILIDTYDENLQIGVEQIDVTLSAANGFEILKCVNLDNPRMARII